MFSVLTVCVEVSKQAMFKLLHSGVLFSVVEQEAYLPDGEPGAPTVGSFSFSFFLPFFLSKAEIHFCSRKRRQKILFFRALHVIHHPPFLLKEKMPACLPFLPSSFLSFLPPSLLSFPSPELLVDSTSLPFFISVLPSFEVPV